MKRGLKFILIVIGIIILLWIGLSVMVRSYFTEERLKAWILPKAEELTRRKVQLDRLQISLFRGIVVKGMSLKEKDGQKDFLRINQFTLSFRLLPLLRKKLIIKKIEVQSPVIQLMRKKDGRYNFNDLIEKPFHPSPRPIEQNPNSIPIAIVSEKLLIRDANLSFIDEENEWPNLSLILDAEFKGSIETDWKPRMESGAIYLKELKVRLKEREIKISGKVEVGAQNLQARFQGEIEKDRVHLTATVNNYLSSPEIKADLHAKTLDLQPLLGLSKVKKESERSTTGETVRKGPPLKESWTRNLRASGQILIDSAKYQDYQFNPIRMSYQYVEGVFKVDPLELKFLSGGSFRAEGSLKGDFQFSDRDPERTLRGKAVASLGKGSIQQSRILDAIASFIGNPSFKHLGYDQGLFNFEIKEQKVFMDGWMTSNLFKLSPRGIVDFNQRLNLDVELRLSPELSKGLDRKLKILRVLEDEKGWKTIPLKIEGTIEKPSVTIILAEGLFEKGIGKGFKEGLKQFFRP